MIQTVSWRAEQEWGIKMRKNKPLAAVLFLLFCAMDYAVYRVLEKKDVAGSAVEPKIVGVLTKRKVWHGYEGSGLLWDRGIDRRRERQSFRKS